MKAFARFRNETWCMNLAYVKVLAKENTNVKFLLVRHDLFDRIIYAKGLNTKISKEKVRAFLTMITKENRPKKIWIDEETEFAGEFKKFAKLKHYKCTR